MSGEERAATGTRFGGIVVANAPVSYGAFEVTVGIDPNVPDGDAILDEVAAAGYAGIDLGPVGYLGEGEELGRKLAARGLGLAGAYLELPFADPASLEAALPELDAMLDTFDAVAPFGLGLPPRPTLADRGVGAGAERRRNAPGAGARIPSSGYTEAQWRAFAQGVDAVVEHCRARGYEPAFHNETGTFVEAPAEIDRLLELTGIGVCLDTGHLLVGGGDPVECLARWSERINHIHVKSADLGRFEAVVERGLPTDAIWEHEVFPPLGEGDLDVDRLLAGLADTGYAGWLIVEQDIFPQTAERFARAAHDQRANRRYLEERGL